MKKTVLIIGAGTGLSASIARKFKAEGFNVALAARNIDKLSELCDEIDAIAYRCNATSPKAVEALFEGLNNDGLEPDYLVFNVGLYERGPITSINSASVKNSLMANAFSAFLVGQAAAKVMQRKNSGVMMFTGASASIKGYAESAPFAMGKFALRGLCQSLARELAPKNIHVVHVVLDGLIYNPMRSAPYQDKHRTLNPVDIANVYFDMAHQAPSTWTWELELRPNSEQF